MYHAKHNETGEVREMTEAEVKAEISATYQLDMGTAVEFSDEQIAEGVTGSKVEDFLNDGVFEGENYKITRA